MLGNDGWLPGGSPSAAVADAPDHGTLSLAADGSFEYTPEAGYVGDDSFTYTLTSAGQSPSTATVSLTVYDQAPQTDAPGFWLHAGTTLVVDDPGLAHYVSDGDAEDWGQLTFEEVEGPDHAAYFGLNSDGTFTYEPEADFVGTDQFQFRVTDGALDSDTVTVSLFVENDPPTGIDDTYHAASGGTLNAASVLDNDYDADGDTLTAEHVALSGPDHAASFTFNADGTFTFAPEAGFVGTTTFSYRPLDGTVAGDPVTVTITVTDGPVALDDYYPLDEANSLVVDAGVSLLNNDFNPGSPDPLRARLVSASSGGSWVELFPDGTGWVQLPDGSGKVLPHDYRAADNTFDGTFSFVGLVPGQVDFSFAYQAVRLGVLGAQYSVPATARLYAQLQQRLAGSVSLKAVMFHEGAGSGIQHVAPDPTQPNLRPYDQKQWNDGNHNGLIEANLGEWAHPIAVVRDSKIVLSAAFAVEPWVEPLLAAFLRYQAANRLTMEATSLGLTFTASHTPGARSNNLVLNTRTHTLTVERAQSTTAIPWKRVYLGIQTLDWDLKLMGSSPISPHIDAGLSSNIEYVLWKSPPNDFPLYETLVKLSSAGGSSINGDKQQPPPAGYEEMLPGAVFSMFEGRDVSRADGTPLKYYGQWTTKSSTTAQLLGTADGQCTSWATFFLDCLKAQGLSYTAPNTPKPKVVVRSARYAADLEWFLVKNWTFYKPPGDGFYGWRNILDANDSLLPDVRGDVMKGSIQQGSYKFPATYLYPLAEGNNVMVPEVDGNYSGPNILRTGLPGQNNPRPFSMFSNHVLVEIGNALYDPSYGAKYVANTERQRLDALEANAIEGYAVEVREPVNGVRADVLRIRKRIAGGGLVITERS